MYTYSPEQVQRYGDSAARRPAACDSLDDGGAGAVLGLDFALRWDGVLLSHDADVWIERARGYLRTNDPHRRMLGISRWHRSTALIC